MAETSINISIEFSYPEFTEEKMYMFLYGEELWPSVISDNQWPDVIGDEDGDG